MLPVLRPITDDEFELWLTTAIPEFARDKVSSGQWPEDAALELSRKAYAELLPQGRTTPKNHLYAVLDQEGATVGTLWFAEQERAGRRIAYVYEIVILSAYRRLGHGRRAFEALEDIAAQLGLSGIALHVFGHNHAAHSLYQQLGYAATNINMFKAVPATGA